MQSVALHPSLLILWWFTGRTLHGREQALYLGKRYGYAGAILAGDDQ